GECEFTDIISDSHASDDTVFIHDVDYSVGHPRPARVENNARKAWRSRGWIALGVLARPRDHPARDAAADTSAHPADNPYQVLCRYPAEPERLRSCRRCWRSQGTE